MLTQILANILGGGFTGYITNVLAVKMLFKKYPVVGGGVILDNYEEFVTNISALVERDLINHATLEHEFKNEKFRAALEKTISYLLSQSLFSVTPDMKLNDVDGFNESLEAYLKHLKRSEPKLLEELILSLLEKIALEDILSNSQIEKLTKKLYEFLVTILENDIGSIIEDFYSEFSDKRVDELIEVELLEKIASNVDRILASIHEELRQFDAQIDTFMDTQYASFQIEKLLYKLQETLKKRSLFDIVGGGKDKNVEQLSNEIIEKFLFLINSKEAEPLLLSLSENLIKMLSRVKHPVSHYVDDELEKQIYKFLQKHLPVVLELIIDWVLQNRHDIEELIDSLIDETLQQGGVLGKFKLLLKDIFVGKIAKNFSLVDRFKNFAQLEDSKDESVALIYEKIMLSLKNNSIGSIVKSLKEKGFLDAPLLADILKENMQQFSSLIRIFIFDELFHMPLNKFADFDFVPFFSQFLFSDAREIFKEHFLYTKSFSDIIRYVVSQEIQRTRDMKVSDLMQNSKVLESFFLETLKEQRSEFLDLMRSKADSFVKTKKSSDLLNRNFTDFIVGVSDNYYQEQRDKHVQILKEKSTHDLYRTVDHYEKSVERLSALTIYMLDENLHYLLEGNVSETVRNELHRLSPKVLQGKVEEFMGEELGPITWLGAGLGATVGASLGSLQGAFAASPYGYVVIPAIYAMTGIATNAIALKMLFRPYEKQKVLGVTIPFTPGIVGKKKPKFAKNMSEFVDKSLLTKDAMHAKLLSFEKIANEKIFEYISKDNYSFLDSLFDKYSNELASTLSHSLSKEGITYMQQNHKEILNLIMGEVKNFDMSMLPSFVDEKSVLDEINSDLDKLIGDIQKNMGVLLNSSKEIADFMPQIIREATGLKISFVVEEYSKWLYELLKEPKKLEVLATSLFSTKYETLSQETFISFMTPAHQVGLNRAIGGFIEERLVDPSTIELIVGFAQRNFLNQSTVSERTVGELFDGKLIEILSTNITIIFSHIADQSMQYLKDEKEEIKEEILAIMKKESGFFANRLMGFTGVFSDVKRLIDIFVDDRLVEFYVQKEKSMNEHLHIYVQDLQKTTLEELGISTTMVKKENLIHLTGDLLSNSYVHQSVKMLSYSFMDELLKLRVNSVASMVNLHTFENILQRFEKEIALSANYLAKGYEKNSKQLQSSASQMAIEVSMQLLLTKKVQDIVYGVKPEMLQNWLQKSKKMLVGSKTFEKYGKKILQSLIQDISKRKVNDFVDLRVFRKDLSNSLKNATANPLFEEDLQRVLKPLIEELIKDSNQIIDDKTKEFIIKIIIESVFDSVVTNAETLMDSIDFKNVIEKEINNMHPSEIEEMFNSFAKIYFDRLILYGGYGAVFGIPAAMLQGF